MELPKRSPFGGLGFSAAEREALRIAGLGTADDVWEAAARDPGQPLAGLAAASGIPAARLREVLAHAARSHVAPAPGGLAARHWLDAVLVAGVVLVVWLALRDAPRPAEPRHVRARGPIAAFQIVDAERLADTTAPAPPDAVPTVAGAAGRVALRAVADGHPLTEANLGPRVPPGAIAGRAVLALSAALPPPGVQPRPGTFVGLMLTPRNPAGRGALLPDVLVLSAARSDTALGLVVALPRDHLPTAASLLGSSDVHVVATAQPPAAPAFTAPAPPG